MPWLLNFNGFCEKLICRIMALLSRGFPLSEPQTLGAQQEARMRSEMHSVLNLLHPVPLKYPS